jgi:hypothetical protein
MSKLLDAKSSSTKEIASALLNCADTFSFVVREGISISKKAIELLESLKPYLIESKKVSEWAGTKLFWEQATMYTYNLNNETAFLLYTSEDNLFKWLLPHLPEDLVFHKNNRPFFVSITHEKDAYFQLEDDEESFLRDRDLI